MRRLFLRGLACVLMCASTSSTTFAYQVIDSQRWVATATNGVGLQQGDPTHLTWSFAPDGTLASPGAFGVGESNLIEFLDDIIGPGPGGDDFTQRPWFPLFESSFDRTSQLSGLSYSYEPNDDGVLHTASNSAGFLGVRGDVRIYGSLIDGPSGILGFNFFPPRGSDMTLDTADGEFFSIPTQDHLNLRNVIMHEHGHGLGLMHTETDIELNPVLMNPFVNDAFDGFQYDDILGLHRLYGDFFEKSNGGLGNDSPETATPLGTVTTAQTRKIGADGRSLFVQSNSTDFISIDDDGDVDYLSFSINNPAEVDIVLTPVGEDYLEGPQGAPPTPFQPSQLSDLAIQVFAADGTTQLAVDNSGGFGESDFIAGLTLDQAGEYFLRITGSENQVQLYEVAITVLSELIDGDFDNDGDFDCSDVDAMVAEIVAGTDNPAFDLSGDGSVDTNDLDVWLEDAGIANGFGGAFLQGDANLDGVVDISDFNVWNENKFTSQSAWCLGDFSADGSVDVSDFNRWNENRFQSSSDAAAVPEPSTFALIVFAMGLFCSMARKN